MQTLKNLQSSLKKHTIWREIFFFFFFDTFWFKLFGYFWGEEFFFLKTKIIDWTSRYQTNKITFEFRSKHMAINFPQRQHYLIVTTHMLWVLPSGRSALEDLLKIFRRSSSKNLSKDLHHFSSKYLQKISSQNLF